MCTQSGKCRNECNEILSLSGKALLGIGKETDLKKKKRTKKRKKKKEKEEKEEEKRSETKYVFPHIPELPKQKQGFLHGPLLPSQCLLVYTQDTKISGFGGLCFLWQSNFSS